MVPYKPKTTEIHKYKNRLIQAKHYGIKTTVLTIMKNISGPGLLHFHFVVVHAMHDVVGGVPFSETDPLLHQALWPGQGLVVQLWRWGLVDAALAKRSRGVHRLNRPRFNNSSPVHCSAVFPWGQGGAWLDQVRSQSPCVHPWNEVAEERSFPWMQRLTDSPECRGRSFQVVE